jgi:hypothetical protein
VGGGGSERQEPHLSRREIEFRERVQSRTTEGADHGQVGMTPGQQALLSALQRMKISRTIEETHQVAHKLALALGAYRTEEGTIKALLAVILLLEHPEINEKDAYTFTGASCSNFKKWLNRVRNARIGLPPNEVR